MRSYSIEGNFSPISMLRAKAGMLRGEGGDSGGGN